MNRVETLNRLNGPNLQQLRISNNKTVDSNNINKTDNNNTIKTTIKTITKTTTKTTTTKKEGMTTNSTIRIIIIIRTMIIIMDRKKLNNDIDLKSFKIIE